MTDSKLAQIWLHLQEIARDLFPMLKKEQSMSMSNIFEQIWLSTMEMDERNFLIDLYVDESSGSISALFAREGKLFLAPVSVSDSGASLGEMIQVKEVFEPVKDSFRVIQTATETRWFLVSSSTVLNRMGYFNTKELFDKLVQRCEQTGKYPYLTFMHLGPVLQMGMTDWVARDGNLLLASGTFDGSENARLMQKAYSDDPEYWGSSISFWPLKSETVEISRGVTLPAYKDGILEEISICPESDACCLLTSLVSQRKVNQTMDPRTLEALKKLVGSDEEKLADLVQRVDGANEKIVTEGLLHQTTSEETPEHVEETSEVEKAPVAEPAPETQEEEKEAPVIEIDDALVAQIVEQLTAHPAITGALKAQAEQLDSIQQSIADLQSSLTKSQSEYSAEVQTLSQRVEKIEAPEKVKQADWLAGLSRSQVAPKATYRPSQQEPVTQTAPSAAEIAESTLANIK